MTAIKKGISHELQAVEFKKDSHFAMHPWGKVPVARDGDFELFETAAICRYIDEKFDGCHKPPSE